MKWEAPLKDIDPVLRLLFYGMLAYTALLLFVEWRFNNDSVVFQVISSIISGFTGAFFGRMVPPHKEPGESTLSVISSPAKEVAEPVKEK